MWWKQKAPQPVTRSWHGRAVDVRMQMRIKPVCSSSHLYSAHRPAVRATRTPPSEKPNDSAGLLIVASEAIRADRKQLPFATIDPGREVKGRPCLSPRLEPPPMQARERQPS